MSRSTLQRPFTGSIVTDEPAYRLRPSDKPFAQDGYSPQGVFTMRRGWAYDGTTADVAANIHGLARVQFVLTDVVQTITSRETSGAKFYVHNATGAGTIIPSYTGFLGLAAYIPRCVYRDELYLCAQNGTNPAIRYSGSPVDATSGGSPTSTAGEATISGIVPSGTAPAVGLFYPITPDSTTGRNHIATFPRILEYQSGTATLEGALTAAAVQVVAAAEAPIATGLLYPAVSVYSAGTATVSSGVATGYGTKWSSGDWGAVGVGNSNRDALLLITATGAQHGDVGAVSDDDTLSVVHLDDQGTKSQAHITRRCPFKDMAAHQGSLWGTGVAQYPSRVYVGPPGWNPAYPPGFVEPVDVVGDFSSSNVNDFLLDFIDVPSSYDGDDNVAILPSPGPLLVLKRNAVYGISGSYPQFSTDLMQDGIGCIDIRSAQSFDEGQFFAGENGVYWYRGGQFIDLTAGKINREWRELTRRFDYGTSDYCTLGMSSGHLWVHITTAGGTIQRTYVCDLRDQSWQSRVTNVSPRYMFTSRIPGEREKLLAVQDADQGRVIDLAPSLDGSGVAKDGDGTSPRLQAWTPENLDGGTMDEDQRMLDLAVHANVYDSGAAGATSMAVSVVTQDALTHGATGTKALSDIDSDQTDRVDRHYFRRVDRRGRRHQVRLDVDTVGTDNTTTKVEVAEITASFRGSRGRS